MGQEQGRGQVRELAGDEDGLAWVRDGDGNGDGTGMGTVTGGGMSLLSLSSPGRWLWTVVGTAAPGRGLGVTRGAGAPALMVLGGGEQQPGVEGQSGALLFCVLRGTDLLCYRDPGDADAGLEPALTIAVNKVRPLRGATAGPGGGVTEATGGLTAAAGDAGPRDGAGGARAAPRRGRHQPAGRRGGDPHAGGREPGRGAALDGGVLAALLRHE